MNAQAQQNPKQSPHTTWKDLDKKQCQYDMPNCGGSASSIPNLICINDFHTPI
jgi:hypothetical protein